MKLLMLAVGVVVWVLLASIPRGGVERKESSWLAESGTDLEKLYFEAPPLKPAPATPPPRTAEASKPVATSRETLSPSMAKPNDLPTLSGPARLVCTRPGEAPRSLSIAHVQGRYELMYEKPGRTEKAAWSQVSTKSCEQIRDRISSKLEAVGFSCKPV